MSEIVFTSVDEVVSYLLKTLSPQRNILLLQGPLGAGKTYLTQILAKKLGIDIPVVSPTFMLMNDYALPHTAAWKHFVHYDWYRLEQPTPEQLEDLQYEDLLADQNNLVIMEWPERLPSTLWPQRFIHVAITIDGEDRTYTITEQS